MQTETETYMEKANKCMSRAPVRHLNCGRNVDASKAIFRLREHGKPPTSQWWTTSFSVKVWVSSLETTGGHLLCRSLLSRPVALVPALPLAPALAFSLTCSTAHLLQLSAQWLTAPVLYIPRSLPFFLTNAHTHTQLFYCKHRWQFR